ncbi:hypothetical protein [Janibacter terrae]|uniref:hypothetical protein n=1 Tax=Janibacter terrae TaxID=103817 RepID=UPI001C3F3086|nr:hypothetical protein [Janibacter terrae]
MTAYSSGAPGVPQEDLDNPPPQEGAQAEATQGVNARGESYGSGLPALSPEEEPDLIAAVATNGQSGYVRASELEAADPGVERPADAANYKGPNRASVPVYKSDGVTVIGHFDLTGDER